MPIGSTANVPVTAALAVGCTVTGPAPYSVAFGGLTAQAARAPLPPPGRAPISAYINPLLVIERDIAVASSGMATSLASYLFMTALFDYYRNGGV